MKKKHQYMKILINCITESAASYPLAMIFFFFTPFLCCSSTFKILTVVIKLYQNSPQNKHKTAQKYRTMDTKTSQKVSISPANIDLCMLGKQLKELVLSSQFWWYCDSDQIWDRWSIRSYRAQISNFRYTVIFTYRKICTTFSLYFEVNCCSCTNVYLFQKWLCEQCTCCPLPIEETEIFWICLQTLNNFPPLKNAMASASLWFISMHWLLPFK